MFLGSAKGEVTISYAVTAKAIYVKSISIEYTKADDKRQEVTLSWNPSVASATLGETFTAPILTVTPASASEAIVYSSSNEKVAKFDENNNLQILAGGFTVIRAEISNNDTFKDAFAEYELTVIDPNAPEEITDILTSKSDCFSISDTKYKSVSYKSTISKIEYDGFMAGGNNSIQLNNSSSNNGKPGIVVKTNLEGYVLKRIELEWNTTADRTLDIYGANKAFGIDNLYDSSVKQIGSVKNGTTSFEPQDDYQFIGIRSRSGAIYLSSITLVWVKKVYTAEGAITVETPYAYEYGNANVLSFAPTIKLNGNTINDLAELAKFNVVLNGKVLGTAAEAIDHFAPKQGAENKFTVTKGDQTIEVTNVAWPEIDVEPAVEQVEYVKADDGNVHAIYYVAPKTNTNGLHWTVATDHPTSLYWKKGHNGAACQFNNVATWAEDKEEFENLTHPSTFDASISFPFAVKKDSAAQGIRLMANGDEYDTENYVAAPQSLADDIQNEDFQPGGTKTQTSGVADVAVDQEGEVEFFNLQGVRVNGELTPGLYIRRQGNRATKVVVK